jgi:hypothetical protein
MLMATLGQLVDTFFFQPLLNSLIQLVADFSAEGQNFLLRAHSLCWVFKRPKGPFRGAEYGRAFLFGIRANNDYAFEVLLDEILSYPFGLIVCYINTDFLHDLDSRAEEFVFGLCACTKSVKYVPCSFPQQGFCYLASSRVTCTQKQDVSIPQVQWYNFLIVSRLNILPLSAHPWSTIQEERTTDYLGTRLRLVYHRSECSLRNQTNQEAR